jgi:hypothetical protein
MTPIKLRVGIEDLKPAQKKEAQAKHVQPVRKPSHNGVAADKDRPGVLNIVIGSVCAHLSVFHLCISGCTPSSVDL